MNPSSFFHPAAEDSVFLSSEPLHPASLLQQCQHPECGGLVMFCGDVRLRNMGRQVSAIEYEVYVPLAQKTIRQILLDAIQTYQLGTAHAVHRIGLVPVGQTAVVVVTAHRHRMEAYKANEEIIYRIKHEVPIWKKEIFTEGDFHWASNDTPRELNAP
ncbi:MAG: molybdenum cofactor biosynthesis protein MoaE [Cytophagaceae bacterium]|jgi:molybdopterin synthase catalytic subunit|nr:molybdenum cofactor biosynthesis protein MoaE [Cytophagaceae bacterium]